MTNIEIKIRSMYGTLSSSDKKVADYILGHIRSIYATPVARLAEESGVSQVTWIRFCKDLGFTGLKELKRSLVEELNGTAAEETPAGAFSDISQYSTAEQMIQSVCSTTVRAVEDTMKILDPRVIEEAAAVIASAKSIRLFGVGASGLVAEDLQSKLVRINLNAVYSKDSHTQLVYAATLQEEDVAVLFSYSGTTKEILEIAEAAKNRGCRIIAITQYAKNPLSAYADFLLHITTQELNHRSGAMSSRIAQLAVVDVLFSIIAGKNYGSIEQNLENSLALCRAHRV